MASPTEKQDSTKELIQDLKEKKRSFDPISLELFEKHIDDLLERAYITKQTESCKNHNFGEVLQVVKSSAVIGGRNLNLYSTILQEYRQTTDELNNLRNVILQTRKNETRAHIKNLCFRTLTTLAVGLSIMVIYALAHYLEIPMPLMRLPVPS